MRSRQTARVIELICGLALVSACAPRETPVPAYGATATTDDAVRVAQLALKEAPDAIGPYSAERDGGVWVVRSHPVRGGSYIVVIEAATGRTEVSAYQVATINEKL